MVENFSKKLISKDDIRMYGLTPCKICKPPIIRFNLEFKTSEDEAQGTLTESVRCKGTTIKGTRCKHMTRIGNGYCYQHTDQNSKPNTSSTYKSPAQSTSITPTCGARTQSGGYCKRKVKGGGSCYQHR